jgi:hypothetical protein
MDNPFKKIGLPPKEVPEELKEKVMDDVSAFLLFMDVATLFSSNYTEAIESFFKKREEKRKNI